MTVSVKLPLVISTSGWQPNVTWSNSSIPISAALCRASLGTWLEDSAFAGYWKQWAASGMPRCAYHYLKNDYGTADQARFFWGCVQKAGGIKAGDKLCLDVEDESNLSIGAVVDWLYNIQVLSGLETKDLLIYSRATVLNPLSFYKLSAAQKEYLLKIPTWPAGYPDDPNPYGFEQLKSFYQADPARFGKCVVIQYAESIEIPGINPIEGRSTECNVADPNYLAQWQAETGVVIAPPTGENMISILTVKSGLNVRSTPGGTIIGAGFLATGDLVMASAKSNEWVQLKEVRRNGVKLTLPGPVCWASRGLTDGYMRLEWDIAESAPPPPPVEIKPEITFNISASGYPVQVVTWKPL